MLRSVQNVKHLRSTVAVIDAELAQLADLQAGSIPPALISEILASWARLVVLLPLGPRPDVRPCPRCNRPVARSATLCGHCWTKLRPPMSLPTARAARQTVARLATMRDEERAALAKIGDVLDELRGRWQDPSRQRQEYVTAGEVGAVNAEERLANPALITTLEELDGERQRLYELLLDGQIEGTAEVQALAAKVDRLRQDFGVMNV
jgi:hypothetical protein